MNESNIHGGGIVGMTSADVTVSVDDAVAAESVIIITSVSTFSAAATVYGFISRPFLAMANCQLNVL